MKNFSIRPLALGNVDMHTHGMWVTRTWKSEAIPDRKHTKRAVSGFCGMICEPEKDKYFPMIFTKFSNSFLLAFIGSQGHNLYSFWDMCGIFSEVLVILCLSKNVGHMFSC